MSFLYPLGLLGLIGVPVLIIIYIIKNKYTEQTVSSTYLWLLSERFLKKKRPISKLSGIVSLILQILIVIAISLSIAQPSFVIPGGAGEYCFILDASGSMNTVQDGKTRFDTAKSEIGSMIRSAPNGSRYTLIYVGNGTTRVLYERSSDKDIALDLLDETTVTDAASSCVYALGFVQNYYNENGALNAYLMTDRAYETDGTIEVVNVAKEETDNFAVLSLDYTASNGTLQVTGKVVSYISDTSLEVELTAERDGEDPVSQKQSVSVQAGKEQEVTFSVAEAADFTALSLRIETEDALMKDNEIVVYNTVQEHDYRALIVSKEPFYLSALIFSADVASVYTITPEEYVPSVHGTGYGLYIFDGFAPETLPDDGSVWLFGLTESVADAGFTVQNDAVDLSGQGGALLEYAQSTSSLYRALTKDVTGDELYVAKYVKYGISRNFTSVLEYEGQPMVFACTNVYGNRQLVFSFDLHDSNFTMLADHIILARNFLEYSFPTIVTDEARYSGDTLSVNVPAGCDSIRLDTPDGSYNYLPVNTAVSEYLLGESGTYTLTVVTGGREQIFSVYVRFASQESVAGETEEMILQGQPAQNPLDGIYDDLLILFIILALIVLADWAVYCYEQYQLR